MFRMVFMFLLFDQSVVFTRSVLNKLFDDVHMVDILDSRDMANLALLDRPDLGVTFTKLHCWRLDKYKKCVFLDADTLVSDELQDPCTLLIGTGTRNRNQRYPKK